MSLPTPPAPEPLTQNQLAAERTLMAYERTLMAWIRTSIALIGFGFSVTQFFEHVVMHDGRSPPLVGPRGYGLVMILVGLLMLVMAAVQHRRVRKALSFPGIQAPFSLAFFFAMMILALGVMALVLAIVA